MRMPGFTAEATLGPSVHKYRSLNSADIPSAQVVTPQVTWSACSADGRFCYTCSNDGGPCICNWFYDRRWLGTTNCGSLG